VIARAEGPGIKPPNTSSPVGATGHPLKTPRREMLNVSLLSLSSLCFPFNPPSVCFESFVVSPPSLQRLSSFP
jgi:hypothetical protein